ncbi:unnamed protein product [Rotaria sp. Silwood2]|nr:unnamed protein product [Rotaria sp. Silwood2]CAF2506314.1 unnamed protein product [Rotaria sp. Silwood2]CAF2905499.1 unnamed protein product [Rotaria sp. Silwood2]CAF4228035.1 unnamed protein product [Rotaria sp. Silwood2]CAF4488123.1 unnamed protein product [Rotaria sp. Silwood2]
MPTESLRNSESSSKHKLKNKIPKRLRRKNKQNDNNIGENITNDIPKTDHITLTKENTIQENAPCLLNTSPSRTDDNQVVVSMDETSMYYWKYCTKKALDILAKQASNRRKLLIERHQERIDSIQCILSQREQINTLTEENHSMSQLIDSLRNEVRTKDENIKSLEEKLHDRDGLIRDNEFLRVQLQVTEQKFQRITIEYSKKMEENHQHEDEYNEQIQSFIDEIERIKRDLVLEEYRKQEAERKVRYYEDKIKIEQNLNKKIQQDLIQLKQELKSIHVRYDSLQIEMLAMHKANNNDISLIPTRDTNENEWSKKRPINHDIDEQLETKRSKRKTRDRTKSSASTTSKNHLPVVTLTEASPSNDQGILVEKDSTQLLIPPSASATSDSNTSTTDSQDTSCESQSTIARTKKQSRYPCRRAQRPVKQIDTSDQVKQC